MDNLIKYQLNGLRALSAINQHGTLNKAAAQLCVSPGAISKQVVRIEEQLGHRVFDRTSNGFIPTANCKDFLAELSEGFERIDSAIASLSDSPPVSLRVTVTPGLARSWLITRLGRFCEQNEHIRPIVDSSVQLADLGSGQYDFAIRFGTGNWPGLNMIPLIELELFPVCAPALAAKLTSIKDLEQLPIIVEQGRSDIWKHWLCSTGHEDLSLKIGPELSSPDLCVEAASSGMGVALVWQTLAIDALDNGDLVVPFTQTVKTGQAYWLADLGSNGKTAATHAFGRWLKHEFRSSQNQFSSVISDPRANPSRTDGRSNP